MIAKHDLFPEREFIVIPYKQGCYSEHVVWCTRNRITLDPKQPLGLIGDSLSTNYWHQNFVNTGDSEYFPPGTVLTLKGFKEENYPEIKSKKLVVLFTVDGKEYKIFWDLFRRNTRIK